MEAVASKATEEPCSTQNEPSTKTILELDVDCCEELFEWLTLADLKALRLSCKRLKRIAEYHIESTYPKAFEMVKIDYRNIENVQSFAPNISKLFKRIEYKSLFYADVVEGITPILKNVEMVVIPLVTIENDLHQSFLQFCDNLKHLCILNLSFEEFHLTGKQYEWLHQTYPKLAQFILLHTNLFDDPEEFPELLSLFQHNPNIQQFATESSILLANQQWIIDSGIKLKQLDLQLHCDTEDSTRMHCNLLNLLHKQQFYKKLHLYAYPECEQFDLDLIATLRGLDKLLLNVWPTGLTWPAMPQLREFAMEEDETVDENLNMLVESIVNVERIHFGTASFNSVLSFIRRSAKLKQIKIQSPNDDEVFCKGGIIDLVSLNKERQKCGKAHKITIFVNENVYLQTKAAFMRTDLGLIELQRAESHVWNLFVGE